MTWIAPEESHTVVVDHNAEYAKLKGQLDEDEARRTYGGFLRYNVGIATFMLTGFILEPYQRIVLKGWMQKNFSLTVASRSFGKSMLFSHFCYLYCLLNPDHHIIMVAPTFRSSRRVLENIEGWAKRKRGAMLRQCIVATKQGDLLTKRQDMYKITFANGSTITALPLGDADNLRGFRCNVLGIDEGLLIPQSTIDLVLKPFLAGASDATKKQLIRIRESKDIAEGKMAEEDRKVFRSTSKMIILSSASYRFQELYELYKKYRAIIEKTDPKVQADRTDDGVSTYLVHQLSYKIVKPELMDPAILREIREKLIPQSIIDREYGAQFVDESGGFFSAKQMNDCTVPPGQRPCIEIVGEKGAQYVLGIDPAGGSIGADPAGDHFAMCVLKIVERKDGRKIGMVVHQYACAGVDMHYHIAYFHYLLKRFNIVYIVIDSTGGENLSFLKMCNESELFKRNKMELNAIQAEFAKEGFDETVRAVKASYNPTESLRRIVQNQYFSSAIIKAGNDNLRACFEQKTILFASGAQSVGDVAKMAGLDVEDMNKIHPQFRDKSNDNADGKMVEVGGSMHEFVCHQDVMIELVKKECAFIEVKSTPLGHLTFDLPTHLAKNRKNVSRVRKDSYSALWLAAWGLKIHLAAQEAPEIPCDDTFTPVLI